MEFKDKTDFANKNQVIGETRFLRAYYHFELVKFFGGIPLKGDKRFSVNDEKSIPRSSTADVYASIEADLLFAIDNLNPIASQKGRATKGAAQALLAKVYLTIGSSIASNANLYDNAFDKTEMYTKAKMMCDSVYTGTHGYGLTTNYADVFKEVNENGKEDIFSIKFIFYP